MNARTIVQVNVQPPVTPGARPVTTSRYTILDRQKPTLRHVLARWETLLALLLLAVFVIGGVSLEHFLDPYNLLDGTVNCRWRC
jgi:rhamnose transport system permease protein